MWVNSTMRLINHNIAVRTSNVSNDQLNLPKQATDFEKQLDIQSLFNGPVVGLEVQCPMCDGSQITVTSSFEEVDSDAVEDANRYIFFKDE